MQNALELIYQKIIAEKREADFAVFDFDNTCIVGDIAECIDLLFYCIDLKFML